MTARLTYLREITQKDLIQEGDPKISKERSPLGDGFHIVIPTAGGERLPITVAGIHCLDGERRKTGLDIGVTVADWGLSSPDAQTLTQVCDALNISLRFVSVSPEYKSAGHSFNTGVAAIIAHEQSQGLTYRPIVKVDDDTVPAPGILGKLREALEQGYDVTSPLIERTRDMNDLLDASTREIYRQRFNKEHEPADVKEIFTDKVIKDGRIDCATIMAPWQFRQEWLINTENYLTTNFPTAYSFNQVGGVFMPERTTGEGVEFYLQAKSIGKRLSYIRNAYVVDRPDTFPSQNFDYGVDDAIFVLMLEKEGLLVPGLHILTKLSDGRVVKITAPETLSKGYRGIMILPEEMDTALEMLKDNGISTNDLNDQIATMIQKINARSKEAQVEPVSVEVLLQKFKKGQRIARGIVADVQRYLAQSAQMNKEERLLTQKGYEIEFPFKTVLRPPFIDSPRQAEGSVYHTLGALAISAYDPRFIMVQH